MYNKGVTRWQKRFTNIHNIRLPLLITIISLIFLILILVTNNKKPNSQLELGLANKKDINLDQPAVRLDPTVEILNSTELIWQIPDNPRSILFLAHGCNGKAANFWDKSPKCEHCVGLPEERAIVIEALSRKFAVVAVSSRGRCWSLMKETLVVERVVKWWVKKQNLESLPLVALGASSGGYFVSLLASRMRFSSIVVMIAEGVFEQIEVTKDYPPTLFVHMPKDKRRKKMIEANVEVMRREGVDVAEVKCMELPLSPSFLADRVPGLDRKISVELFDLFREKGFVDEKGYLVNDGRVIPWKEAMRERKVSLPDKVLVNYIQEELNLAFGYHEMTSLQSEQMFNWFESHLR